ncbi:cupin domain-containing protein [Budviciaceae bacterium BWR-B9]|uniref:Cupin domain-containing protein n=1 Tax=Limnobaculum allomyrinae TaxID=2791986 RepID=A0ABS1ILL2_9GAMM|nr:MULTISPECIES: cupin domain-containing protein [Limnobaculum]MBK5142631.1 cupin domain-containing protein [Limnobaculum allomyrinae]MBV7690483.1 cupin domain-containing protein [Limnobaculum sp. M2-1]
MKKAIILALAALSLPVSAMATQNNVIVSPAGSQPTTIGAADYFTGTAKVDSRFQRSSPARIGGGIVSFDAGARTAWHTHPLGQTLIVSSGTGWVQQWGNEAQQIKTGDVVWIPPGVKHWHGASASQPLVHIAISESLEGRSVTWMEKVTDSQYPR